MFAAEQGKMLVYNKKDKLLRHKCSLLTLISPNHEFVCCFLPQNTKGDI